MKKYVKIISCASPELWYYYSIGGIFIVKDVSTNMYLTEHGKSIYKKDCQAINLDLIADQDPKYAKIVTNHVAYYIDQKYLSECFKEYDKTTHNYLISHNYLMLFSNFAVNLETNKIIKCRWSVEDLVDKFTNIT